MFLDCVSVLHGQDSKQAEAVWKAWWPGRAIRAFGDLQRSTLVSIDDKGRLVVHDVIRLLGRTMLQDPSNAFYGSRVWVGADGQLVEFPEQVRDAGLEVGSQSMRTGGHVTSQQSSATVGT